MFQTTNMKCIEQQQQQQQQHQLLLSLFISLSYYLIHFYLRTFRDHELH